MKRQLAMTQKVKFLKYSINIFHVVKFIFITVKSSKHHMHETYKRINFPAD